MEKLKVLICDDHRFIRDSLQLTLSASGLPLEVVGMSSNGVELEELARRTRPGLVITDIRMPRRDGLEAIEHLVADFPSLKVIVVTGYQEFEYARRALRSGVADIVTKPIRDEELLGAVRKVVESGPKDEEGTDAPAHSRDLLSDILSYIDSHFPEALSLEVLGEKFRVHPSHVSRLISKNTGETFLHRLNRRRMEEAYRLLKDPRIRVKEVPAACGIADYGHFLQLFQKAYGCNPSDLRKSHE